MKKVVVEKEKIEVIQKVRLTSSERQIIDRMYCNGGRHDRDHLDWKTQASLLGLKLIEERAKNTPDETKRIKEKIATLWGKLGTAVAKHDLKTSNKLVEEIEQQEREIDKKTFWLTAEGRTYCEKGSVQIIR